MNPLNLGGHSGCGIHLMETDYGTIFVRKTSKDHAYNSRLQAQCAKQRKFVGNHNLRTPAVFGEGFDGNGLFYFDMEYVQGITLAEYIKTIEIGKIDGLVTALLDNLIPHSPEDSNTPEQTRDCFSSKLDQLSNNLTDKPDTNVGAAFKMLDCHNWSTLPFSSCHGDLTLENIIVKNDQLYLIDFLDSFYDSWLLDIGALLQDVQAMWSFRYSPNVGMNAVLRLLVFRDVLLDKVKLNNPNYITEAYYALLLKLVRIYPYTNDQPTLTFLDEKLAQTMRCIKTLEEGALL